MTIDEAHARIKSRVWQTLAKSDLEIKHLPESDLDELVEMVTNAALLEIDAEIGKTLEPAAEKAKEAGAAESEEAEEILWEGRPLLSVSTRYVITNERVRLIEGLLGKERVDIELVRIQDIDQKQSVGERLLNVGDIIIHSHDRSHPKAELRNVREPENVHEILRRAVLAAREKHRLSYREEM